MDRNRRKWFNRILSVPVILVLAPIAAIGEFLLWFFCTPFGDALDWALRQWETELDVEDD